MPSGFVTAASPLSLRADGLSCWPGPVSQWAPGMTGTALGAGAARIADEPAPGADRGDAQRAAGAPVPDAIGAVGAAHRGAGDDVRAGFDELSLAVDRPGRAPGTVRDRAVRARRRPGVPGPPAAALRRRARGPDRDRRARRTRPPPSRPTCADGRSSAVPEHAAHAEQPAVIEAERAGEGAPGAAEIRVTPWRRPTAGYRRIAALALPALVVLAAEPLYVLVDTAVVGHLGRVPLAALALGGSVMAAGRLARHRARLRHHRAAPPAASAPGDRAAAVAEGVQASWLALGRRAALAGRRRSSFAGPLTRALAGGGPTPRSPRAAAAWLRIAALGAPGHPARHGRQRLDARRAGHPPPAALRARRQRALRRALPAAGLPGRARAWPAPRSPTWPRRPLAGALFLRALVARAGAAARRARDVLRRQLVGQPRPARARRGVPGLLPVRGRGRGPVRRGRARRPPDRAAAVVLLRAGAGRGGDRRAVAGRRGARRRRRAARPGALARRIALARRLVAGSAFARARRRGRWRAARAVHRRSRGTRAGADRLAVVRRACSRWPGSSSPSTGC